MKKIILLLVLCSLMTGCSNLKGESSETSSQISESSVEENIDNIASNDNTGSNSQTSESSVEESIDNTESSDPVELPKIDEIETPKPITPIEFDNEREDHTVEEAAEILGKYDNFNITDGFTASVPKHIEHMDEFTERNLCLKAKEEMTPEEKYIDFVGAYKYLFSNRELHEDSLFYVGDFDENADINDPFNGIKPFYENIDSYANGSIAKDSLGYFWYNDAFNSNFEPNDGEIPVSLTVGSPFGTNLCYFNRSVSQHWAGKSEGSEFYLPSVDFSCIARYSPDSDKVYKLLDKEISVKDAVIFFENYINSMPSFYPVTLNIHVNKVEVYRLDNEHYGYYFYISNIYDRIPYDYSAEGVSTVSGDLLGYGGGAFMVKSDEVDSAFGINRTSEISDNVRHTDCISFEKAAELASKKLTEHVKFDVLEVSLVYGKESVAGTADTSTVKPYYKFTLFNPNDNMYYICYQSAINEDSFKMATVSDTGEPEIYE